MLRILLTLTSLSFVFSLYAQNPLTVSPNPAEISADISEDKLLPTAYLKNNSQTDTFTFLWRRIIVEMPHDWEPAVCDQTACYPPSRDVCPDDSPNILLPGDSATFYVQLKPHGIAGTALIRLEAYPVGFPDSVLVTGEYHYTVLSTGTREVITLQNPVFPNPAGDWLHLQLDADTEAIHIVDNSGRLVREFGLSVNHQYDIRQLPSGSYWIQVIRRDRQPVRAIPFVRK